MVSARDGYQLAVSQFDPSTTPKAAIQINSGTGVPRQFYRHFASWLASLGYMVVTYDYRGIGDSLYVDIRQMSGHIREWGELDAVAITDHIGSLLPDIPVIGIGHSMGGQVFGLQMNNDAYEKLICIAAQSGYWGCWEEPRQTRMKRLWGEWVPQSIKENGYFAGEAVGNANLPAGIAESWAHWGLSPDYIVDDDGVPLRKYFHRLTAPMHFIRFTDDETAPLRAVEALMGFYENAEVDLSAISPNDYGFEKIGHFGFFKKESELLWQAVSRVIDI